MERYRIGSDEAGPRVEVVSRRARHLKGRAAEDRHAFAEQGSN